MKKLLAIALFTCSALYALPVLNPAEPALLTQGIFLNDADCFLAIKFGYRGDFVYNKPIRTIDAFSIYSNEGVLTCNLWNRLDIYGMVGANSVYLNAEAEGLQISLNTQTHTLWGIGAKVIALEQCWNHYGTSYISLSADYQNLNNAPLLDAEIDDQPIVPGGQTYRYYETQISLGIAHKIGWFSPYVAAKWSNAAFSLTNPAEGESYKGIRHWGYAVGVTLTDDNKMDVTAEARFIDEKALSVAANIRF